jgi:hypothetical protein
MSAEEPAKRRPGCSSCVDGWTGYRYSDGYPFPCVRCRPHIGDYLRRHRATVERWSERPEERHDKIMAERRAGGQQ